MVFTSARSASIVGASSGRRSVLTIHCAIVVMSSLLIPRVVQAGVPEAQPAGTQGRARIVGDDLLVRRDADGVEGLFGSTPIETKTRHRIDHKQMVVGAAGDQCHAFCEKRRGQCP